MRSSHSGIPICKHKKIRLMDSYTHNSPPNTDVQLIVTCRCYRINNYSIKPMLLQFYHVYHDKSVLLSFTIPDNIIKTSDKSPLKVLSGLSWQCACFLSCKVCFSGKACICQRSYIIAAHIINEENTPLAVQKFSVIYIKRKCFSLFKIFHLLI